MSGNSKDVIYTVIIEIFTLNAYKKKTLITFSATFSSFEIIYVPGAPRVEISCIFLLFQKTLFAY